MFERAALFGLSEHRCCPNHPDMPQKRLSGATVDAAQRQIAIEISQGGVVAHMA